MLVTSVFEMKPHNRIKGRSTFPGHGDHVLERVKIITRELEAIQAEIHGRISQGRIGEPAGTQRSGLLEDAASAQVLGQFKAALDELRNMLWLCTQAAAGEATAEPGGVLDNRQLARAAALLRALAPSGAGSSLSSSSSSSMLEAGAQESASFFDRLDRVIDNYMQGGGTLVEPTPRRRQKP